MTGLFASKRYDDISYSKDCFFTDAAAGTLPNVTFIEPDYGTIAEFTGTRTTTTPTATSSWAGPMWPRCTRR
jgi:hypothetical protein